MEQRCDDVVELTEEFTQASDLTMCGMSTGVSYKHTKYIYLFMVLQLASEYEYMYYFF